MQHRCLIANDFADQVRDQLTPAAYKFELFRIFDQRHQSAAHGIARGVVAANDQKTQRADKFARRHVAGRIGMREHRNQVERRWCARARIPQLAEIFSHLGQFGETLLLRMHDSIG